MGDKVKPAAAPPVKLGLADYFARAVREAPYPQKIQYVPSLVLAVALERGGLRAADAGDIAAIAGSISVAYIEPTDRQRLYDDVADAVRLLAVKPPGRKAPRGASDATTVRPVEVADPVEHFRGEYIHESTDLVVRGAGIDFAFHRTYRHQTVYDGPLGHRWDHGYNLFVTLNEQRALLWTGTGRQEMYLRHARWGDGAFNYYVPPDGLDTTLEPLGRPDAPAGWVRRAPDGMRHIFEPEPGWSGTFRLARIEDRWGNYLRFVHVDGRLDRCYVNHEARWVRFLYDAEGRVIRVADFAGRAWRYDYDSHGDLLYVTSPPTDSRKRGCTTEYRYSTAEHPSGPLAHNLTDVFDPEGRHYLRNRYGISVGMEDYNRVVYQRLAHGDFWFRYGAVEPDVDEGLPFQDRPAMRCWVKERNAYQTLYIYNATGNLLRKEETHKQGGAKGTRVVWRYRYNRDGQLVASRSPEGAVTHALTGRDHFYRVHGVERNESGAEDSLWRHDALTADARRGFGRVLATVNRARHHTATAFDWSERWGDVYQADADDLVVKYTYEPAYGQLLTVSDPRATTSSDPRAFEPPEHDRLLTRYEYEGPPSDATRDLVRVIAPVPTLLDGTLGAPVVSHILARDARGRVTRSRDAVGTETVTDHYPESADARAGFVRRVVVDPGNPAAGHLNITTDLEVDELGRVTATTSPRGVEFGDGRFIRRAKYDALDRVTVARGPTPFAFEIRTRYEPAGKPDKVEVDWRDPDGAPRGLMVRRFKYNEEHQVVKETWGGEDIGSHFRIAHRYDPAGTLRFTMAANDTTVHFRYDSRDQLVKTIRSYGVAGESTSVVTRDKDSRVVAMRSGEGRTEAYEVDVFGRTVAVTDPLGNVTRTSYDKAGRPTVVRQFERREDGTFWLLARTEAAYDELGRVVRMIANRFDEPLPATDLVDEYESAPGPGRRVESHTFLDAAGRVVAAVDPLGHRTTTAYDAIGRVIRVTDVLGNRVETRYDAHDNAIRKDRVDVVRDLAGNVLGEEVFSWVGAYDERDRLVAETDGLGNTTHYAYDSLDRCVRTTDPLGNISEVEYDIYGRVIATSERRTDNGLGDGNPLPPATVRLELDRSGNVLARIDALGRRTEFRYDRSNRVVEQIFPDGARVATRYDRDDLVTAVRDAHGAVVRTEYDAAGRPVRTLIDDAEVDVGVVLEGARLVEYGYDGLDRLTFTSNDAASITTRFDSLGHAQKEDSTIAEVGGLALSLERRFDDAGRLTGITYPGGRQVRHDRDELGRLHALVHEADGAGYPGAASPGPRPLATFAYAGGRLRQVERPNGTTTSFDHDGAGRWVQIHHTGSAGTLLRVQRLHDAARNPRLRLEAAATPSLPAPPSARSDRFGYDAQYQLAARADGPARLFADLAAFAPPATPQTPVPHRQPLVDAAIGDFLPPVPAEPVDAWTYDLVGNRTRSRDAGGATHAYLPNERDEYDAIDGVERSYDRAGNLLSDGRFDYRYDAWRRLCRVIDRGTGTDVVRYAYDPAGRRVVEEPAGTPALTVAHDGVDRIADSRDGVCVAQYVHGDAVDDPLHLATGGSDAWYHADHQGSVRALTDGGGATIGAYRFDAFGRLVELEGAPVGHPGAASGLVAQPHGFGGRPFDPAVGLYDQRARSYDPAAGRFIQRDPAGPVDGTNLYSYAGNHPVGFGDVTGLNRGDLDRRGHESVRDGMEPTPVAQSERSSWLESAGGIATGIIKRATVYSPTGILFQLEYAKGFFETASPLLAEAGKKVARRAIWFPGALAYEGYQTVQALRRAPDTAARTATSLGDAATHPLRTLEVLGPDGNFGRLSGRFGALAAGDRALGGKGLQAVAGLADAVNDLRRLRLYHGTDPAGAQSILADGVRAVSRNTARYPQGSFFTHIGRGARRSASHWAWSRAGQAGVLLAGDLPRSVYNKIKALGQLEVSWTGFFGFTKQTVFLPDSFPLLNQYLKWKQEKPRL